jgi:hypothetical protein
VLHAILHVVCALRLQRLSNRPIARRSILGVDATANFREIEARVRLEAK